MYKILCVGKVKDDYITKGIDEYSKRINGFTKFIIQEVKETNTNDIKHNIETEGIALLSKINEDDYVITLEILGKSFESVEFSKYLENLKTYGNSNIIFVIGGSNGLSDAVKKRSNLALSFSKFTFPHQLMRLILVEQIYRSIAIEKSLEYHK